MTFLSRRFDDALVYANTIHASQTRKGTGIPYMSHLMGVCSLTLEHGGDEDQAIAALLHDAVEDCGGEGRLKDIRSRFGEDVALIVDGEEFDPYEHFSDWRERQREWTSKKSERTTVARQRASELRAQDVPYQVVADRMNSEGLRSATGKPWTADSVRKLISGL